MLQAFRSLGHNQFEYARWCAETRERYKIIQVAVATENERRWDTVISNLVTQSDSTVLITHYAYPYEIRQHIFYRNKWWEIVNVGERTMDENPQAMRLINPQFNMQYILEIRKVNWL